MGIRKLLGAAAALVALASSAWADPARIATWNIANLHYETGVPLRDRAAARTEADYALRREYRDRVGADVWALQEVNGPKAVRRVFPEDQWDVFVSGRYLEDARTGAKTDRIYTAFAVRRGAFDAVASSDVDTLGIRDDADRSTRWGLELLVERDGARLIVLNVHLKSGCHDGALRSPRGDDCRILAAQRRPLDKWIDAWAADPTPSVILGDFNRRFRIHGDRDHLWETMDDGEPRGLHLARLPDSPSNCNSGFEEPIDFVVFDGRVASAVVRGSCEETGFDPGDYDAERRTPSDHCPISVNVDFSALR